MVKDLTRDEMRELADYFAKQKPPPQTFKVDPAKAKLGRAKADETLCTMCHLGGFAGQNEIPRVAGQHYAYIVKQLTDFKAQEAHQRRRQHDQRREHAERAGHREPRALPGRALTRRARRMATMTTRAPALDRGSADAGARGRAAAAPPLPATTASPPGCTGESASSCSPRSPSASSSTRSRRAERRRAPA